eukprot:bmy_21413T0
MQCGSWEVRGLGTQQAPPRLSLPLEERSHSQEAARGRGAFAEAGGVRSSLLREQAVGDPALTRATLSRSPSSHTVSGQIEAMAILFAVVARGTTILAKHAWCGGNFLEVTEQILAKIPSENNKLTYSHGNYLFHYICQDRIVYLCITDDDFERSRAFNFLNEIKKRFQTTYGSRAQTALPYAMNSEFSSVLAAQLKHHSENKGLDKVMETQAQVDELKGIMVRNIGMFHGILCMHEGKNDNRLLDWGQIILERLKQHFLINIGS